MNCPFTVGQRVVFIGPGNYPRWPKGYQIPIYGRVYTVREITLRLGDVGLLLKEIAGPIVDNPIFGPVEMAFSYIGQNINYGNPEWAPAVDRKTDISIFQKMLTNNRVTA